MARQRACQLFVFAGALLWFMPLLTHSQPETFPWCPCNTNNYDTPFLLERLELVNSTEAVNTYAITIGKAACLGVSPCCNQDLNKLQFHINDKCRSSVDSVVVATNLGLAGGYRVHNSSATFESFGLNKLSFKVTNLGWNADQAYGSKIFFSLLKNSPCPDKATFFADSNVYAIHSSDKKCCPVSYFSALVNPSGSIYGSA